MADSQRIARFLADQHAAGRPYAGLSGALAPASLEEAYAAQQALVALWQASGRGALAGYKIALTSKAMQAMTGVDQPCAGSIFAADVHSSPAVIDSGRFQHIGLEFEMAVRLGRDLPASEAPWDAERVRPFIDACMPAFEIIEDRNADYSRLEALSLIADNAWNGGVVLGAPQTGWAGLDMANTPVRLDYDGESEGAVTGAAMGNPLNSVAWLANLLAGQGRAMAAGMIVMTGSTLATRFPEPGARAAYAIEGLGRVELRVA